MSIGNKLQTKPSISSGTALASNGAMRSIDSSIRKKISPRKFLASPVPAIPPSCAYASYMLDPR